MKFAIRVHNQHLSKAIQELAFNNGYEWAGDGKVFYKECIHEYGAETTLCFNEHSDGKITYSPYSWYRSKYPSISIYDAKTDWDKIELAIFQEVIE